MLRDRLVSRDSSSEGRVLRRTASSERDRESRSRLEDRSVSLLRDEERDLELSLLLREDFRRLAPLDSWEGTTNLPEASFVVSAVWSMYNFCFCGGC